MTELIIDLGLADYLVGRTGFCIHPAHAVARIPKVGGTKAVNIEKIKALQPTHLVVNVDENEKPLVDALRPWVPHVVVTHPQTPADNVALIDQLVAAFSPQIAINSVAACAIPVKAKALKDLIFQGLARLNSCTPPQPVQRVLYLIWQNPWMTVAQDTYISRMLGLIGWQTWPPVQGGDGLRTPGATRYPVLQGDEPWLSQIDRVLLSSEPYSFGAVHVAQVQAWLPHASVQLVDGEMLSWYGSRAVTGLAYLATLSATASEPLASPA